MSIVTLVSGGLDSTLVACLAKEMGNTQYPLFIDYGQRARDKEIGACRRAMQRLDLPAPAIAGMSGFGELIRSGLTDKNLRIVEDAFTPGRNTLFLLIAAAYGHQMGADAIAIGLLHEGTSLFPDQTSAFLSAAETMLRFAIGRDIKVLAPLNKLMKQDVVALAKAKGIDETYSCHSGEDIPCGQCIACKEFQFEEN
jgi:7-cyano-7-deazaguanine synthase